MAGTEGDKGVGKPNDPAAKPGPMTKPTMTEQGEMNKAATPDRADARPGHTPPETKLAEKVTKGEGKDLPPGHDYRLDPMPKAIPTAIYSAAKGAQIKSSQELPDGKYRVVVKAVDGSRSAYTVGRDGNIFAVEPMARDAEAKDDEPTV